MAFTRNARTISPDDIPVHFRGPIARVAHACYSAFSYPLKLVWPFDLACHYEIPSWANPLGVSFVASMVAFAVLTAALIRVRRERPGLLASWAAYLILLAPTSGLAPLGNFIAADRYSFIPTMALVPLLAAGLEAFLRRACRSDRRVLAVALALPLVGLATLTRSQSETWRDELTLWKHAFDHSSTPSSTIHNNLGVALMGQERPSEALDHFARSMAVRPNLHAFMNQSGSLAKLDRVDEAVERFVERSKADPDQMFWRLELGRFLFALEGRLDQSIDQFRQVVRRWPDRPGGHFWLGHALARRGDLGEAVEQFERALQLGPEAPEVRRELDEILSRRRLRDRAASPQADDAPTPRMKGAR